MADQEKIEFIEQFQKRTKKFSLQAVQPFRQLPKNDESQIIGKQFLRSALSVGANYRAACRARSKAELFAKLSITVEEADEVVFWLEVLTESGIVSLENVRDYLKEADEILKVLSKARKTLKP
jgi:four helix bundle protein